MAVSFLCRCWKSTTIRYLCLLGAMVFICRPSVSTMLARVFVNFARLTVRRILHFLSILIEGMMDEIIMQIEFTVRDALPTVPEVTQAARSSFNLLSHVCSGVKGAIISILISHRRIQQAGWAPPLGCTPPPPHHHLGRDLDFSSCMFTWLWQQKASII